MVPDGATIVVDGSGGGVNEPAAVIDALELRFLEHAAPRDLTLFHVSGMGSANGDGIDRFAHVGMVRRVIGGHWGWSRNLQEMAADEQVEAYCLPQGTLSHLLRDIAAGRPGNISRVGLGTFVDPRVEGGRLNRSATEPINELITLRGEEFLFTPSLPIDVAVVRGSTADELGNITMESEGMYAETLAAAQAAKNSGGIVIAQVRELVPPGTLVAGHVRIPGVLVDALVVDPTQRLSFATERDAVLEGRERAETLSVPALPLNERKVIARRAAAALVTGDVVNLGFGMPDGVAAVLVEEDLGAAVTFTVEQGHIGGVPAWGTDFGLARNADASFDEGSQFDWYDGGGIDTAVLSFAELDVKGDVNVSRFGRRAPGIGGFVNISQGASRVVFVGTFTAKGPWEVSDEGIRLPPSGKQKLVERVEQISFSAAQALHAGRQILYVTERAVFKLTESGPMLIEIAPGVDLQRDVLDQMGFVPPIAEHLTEIDRAVYASGRMGLRLQPGKDGGA
ncbi:acyl CoA:acetate/3-ketoacid CoA transferase [Agrococcus sp. ARC_14]|nr:acyl CoA:acetate/3-ketoacid CoA transferase [Agrococcus sp. ARC_14]